MVSESVKSSVFRIHLKPNINEQWFAQFRFKVKTPCFMLTKSFKICETKIWPGRVDWIIFKTGSFSTETFFAKREIKFLIVSEDWIFVLKNSSLPNDPNSINLIIFKGAFSQNGGRVPLTIRVCAVSSNNLIPSAFKPSAIDVTAKTLLQRNLVGPRTCKFFCPESMVPMHQNPPAHVPAISRFLCIFPSRWPLIFPVSTIRFVIWLVRSSRTAPWFKRCESLIVIVLLCEVLMTVASFN